MDISLMSISLSQGKVQQQASLSVMEIAMGNAEQQGGAVQELISSANIKSTSTSRTATFRREYGFGIIVSSLLDK
ncbi:YjfB family protein [Priestia aryabhattai]|uniref:YjfB family protein n=1 Tax=Priestia TaxID=2800373 RepID=UPI002E1CBA26|nr:YjfB family protein [Priestia aryabhattai]